MNPGALVSGCSFIGVVRATRDRCDLPFCGVRTIMQNIFSKYFVLFAVLPSRASARTLEPLTHLHLAAGWEVSS